MGKSTINGHFSIATLNYQRVHTDFMGSIFTNPMISNVGTPINQPRSLGIEGTWHSFELTTGDNMI